MQRKAPCPSLTEKGPLGPMAEAPRPTPLPSYAVRQEERGGEAAAGGRQTPGPGGGGSSAGRHTHTGTNSLPAALASPALPAGYLQTAGAWRRFPEIKKIVRSDTVLGLAMKPRAEAPCDRVRGGALPVTHAAQEGKGNG